MLSPIIVNARDDEEKARAFCPTRSEATKAKDYCSFIFLNNLLRKLEILISDVNVLCLDATPDRDWQCDDHKNIGEDGDEGPNEAVLLGESDNEDNSSFN